MSLVLQLQLFLPVVLEDIVGATDFNEAISAVLDWHEYQWLVVSIMFRLFLQKKRYA